MQHSTRWKLIKKNQKVVLFKKNDSLIHNFNIRKKEVSMALEDKNYDLVVVGGGLAGLSVASLALKEGKKVALLEKAKLGGRAITAHLKGFSFNMGAHAIYARDCSYLSKIQKDLNLKIDWLDFSPDKAVYDLGSDKSVIPGGIMSLYRNKMMNGKEKIGFAMFVAKTVMGLNKGEKEITIGEWFSLNNVDGAVKEMLFTLASSNFFTKEPENIPSDVFFRYYKRIFKTRKPVSYIKGGWASLIREFQTKIEELEGEIQEKVRIQKINLEAGKVISLETKDNTYKAEKFVFCIPPGELTKLFLGTNFEQLFAEYSASQTTNVMFYDVGLSERVSSDFSYVYDIKNKMFITDISAYDNDSVPENGQLLQAVKYLSAEEGADVDSVDQNKKLIEEFYDKHFPGWREKLVVNKFSKKAVVQYIDWKKGQSPMPIYREDLQNVYFAGDWCEGEGQLSELSFSSAYKVVKLLK